MASGQDRYSSFKKYSRNKLSLIRISWSYLKILPKEPSTLPFSWAPELHGAFIDPDLSDEVKNSLSDFNKFQLRMNSYCKKIDEALIPKADLLWGKGRDFLRIFSWKIKYCKSCIVPFQRLTVWWQRELCHFQTICQERILDGWMNLTKELVGLTTF